MLRYAEHKCPNCTLNPYGVTREYVAHCSACGGTGRAFGLVDRKKCPNCTDNPYVSACSMCAGAGWVNLPIASAPPEVAVATAPVRDYLPPSGFPPNTDAILREQFEHLIQHAKGGCSVETCTSCDRLDRVSWALMEVFR